MKLQQIQSALGNPAINEVRGRINEYANLHEEWRKSANDFSSGFNRNATRALLAEYEPQSIGSGLGCREGVGQIGDATDFDFDGHSCTPSIP